MAEHSTNAHPIPDAALDGDIAILGRKGGGKTYTAKGIVERLLDLGRRVLVLDPLGVWPGLRTAADGDKPGYPVAIFGGQHADLPLDTAAAVAMADVLARENVPAVIDLSDLSKTAQQSFLLAFLHELRRVNSEALTLVLEEADVFAPQQPMGDDSKQLHGEIDWIARRGRYKGFRLVSICQRPARLSKDVLTQANMLIMHRLPSPQDQGAGMDWIKSNGDMGRAKQVEDTLGSLPIGEAWVLAQEPQMLERARFPRIKTLDTSATPRAGERRIEPKTLAQVDLTPIRTALDAATARDHDSKASRKRVEAATDPKALEEAERRGYDRGHADGYAFAKSEVREWLAPLFSAVDTIRPLFDHEQSAPRPRQEITEKTSNDRPKPPAPPRKEISRPAAGDGAMPTGARKIVDVVDVSPARAFTWTQVAMLAGYSESGGAFRSGKKWLLDAGTVVEEGGRVRIASPSGKNRAPHGEDLVAMWGERLPAAGGRVLIELWCAKPRALRIEVVADLLGYATTGGAWRSGIKALRDAGIAQVSSGQIAFTPEFLEIAGAGR